MDKRSSCGLGLGFGFGLVLAAIGCSGSSSDGGGGGSGNFAADYAAYCEKMAERDTKCGDTPDQSACLARQTCFETHWRTSALSSALSCDAARDCSTTDDACYANAGAQVSSPALSAYKTACSDWLQQCGGGGDLCAPGAGLLGDPLLTQLTECMKKPCTDASTCLSPLVDQFDCFN